MYTTRAYRNFNGNQRLVPFQVTIKETDLYIKALSNLEKETREFIITYRDQLETYIRFHPEFEKTLVPFPDDESAPLIVREMIKASSQTGVGPMAAVAGGIAEFVGKSLLAYSPEIIVENGGDIFAFTREDIIVEIFAGTSPLSQKIGVKIIPQKHPLGICTSSGTVGPSRSFGKADAVTVLSSSTFLADAAATAIGNVIKNQSDIPNGLAIAKTIPGLCGVIIIAGDKMGAWGELELIKI